MKNDMDSKTESLSNMANDVVEIALTAMDYMPGIGAVNYAIRTVETKNNMAFPDLYLRYIWNQITAVVA